MIDIFLPSFLIGLLAIFYLDSLSNKKFLMVTRFGFVILFLVNLLFVPFSGMSYLSGLNEAGSTDYSEKISEDFNARLRKRANFFLRGIDGYEVDGLLQPKVSKFKNPILYRGNNYVNSQISGPIYLGYRILKMNGDEVLSLSDLLEKWKTVPERGVAHFRIVYPTPDHALQSIFISPAFLRFDRVHENREGTKDFYPIDNLLSFTGNSGFPGKFLTNMGEVYQIIFGVKDKGALSLAELEAYFDAADYEGENVTLKLYQSNVFYSANEDIDFLVQPRLLLAPWIGDNWVSQASLGLVSHFTRIFLGLRHLPTIFNHWEMLPKQLYKLVDQPSRVFLLTRAVSILVSIFLALFLCSSWLWARIKISWINKISFGQRYVLMARVLLFSLLQVCDIFVVRVLSIT